MNVRRILCIVSALCIVCGLAGCGRKGEGTPSSAAPESASSAAAATDAVEIPFDEDLYLEELNKRRATSRVKEDLGITFDTTNSYGSKTKTN